MKFTPKTQKELDDDAMMPEGIYPFVISGAEDKQSKAGNEMMELTVRVFKEDGTFNLVSDYLLEKLMYKLLHCTEACGLTKEFESGELTAEDFIGKEGMLKLGIQDAQGDFPARNTIKDYLAPEKVEAEPVKKALDDLEDEIPF